MNCILAFGHRVSRILPLVADAIASATLARRGMIIALALLWTFGSCASSANATSVVVSTDTTLWRAIGPSGDLQGTPIDSVGLAWESTNIGWNTSLAYDDSNAAGWHSPITRGSDASFNYIWSEGPLFFGDTPSYFRYAFSLDGPVTLASLSFFADDDAKIWLNGNLVVNDTNNTADTVLNLNATAYLNAGINLIAVKAHNSFGGAALGQNSEGFALRLDIQTVPEPSAFALGILGALSLAALGRRLRRRRLGRPDFNPGKSS